MLVKIAGYVWLEKSQLPKSSINKIKSMLTLIPRRTSEHQQEIEPIVLFREVEDALGVPRSWFFENQKMKNDFEDRTSVGHKINVPFSGELNEDQKAAVMRIVAESMNPNFTPSSKGGIIKAVPGWGKTVASLAVASELGMSTLVIVQREYLAEQWRKRIAQFLPTARVGLIQGDCCQYGPDYDISIAMIQTLVKRTNEYPQEFWNAFGLTITDEAHHVSAPSWNAVIPRFQDNFRLGLTATPIRKDGTQDVFLWHIGPIVHNSTIKRVIPGLRRVFTKFELIKTPTFDPSMMSKEIQLRFLCKDLRRNTLIADELRKAVEVGRKVLVLSERRKHLEILKERFGLVKPEGCVVDFYVGGREQEDLDLAEKAQVLFATYQMAKEALDIPALDTVFLTTPIADVEQAVGRIMREFPDKRKPIVTDFIDLEVPRFKKLWANRLRFYKGNGMIKKEDVNAKG